MNTAVYRKGLVSLTYIQAAAQWRTLGGIDILSFNVCYVTFVDIEVIAIHGFNLAAFLCWPTIRIDIRIFFHLKLFMVITNERPKKF